MDIGHVPPSQGWRWTVAKVSLTPAEADRHFRELVENSVFACEKGRFNRDGVRTNLYPLKSGDGYLWIVWDMGSSRPALGTASILAAGLTDEHDEQRAAGEAVEAMYAYLQRRLATAPSEVAGG